VAICTETATTCQGSRRKIWHSRCDRIHRWDSIRLASAPGCDKDYYNRKGYPSMQLQVHQYTPN